VLMGYGEVLGETVAPILLVRGQASSSLAGRSGKY